MLIVPFFTPVLKWWYFMFRCFVLGLFLRTFAVSIAPELSPKIVQCTSGMELMLFGIHWTIFPSVNGVPPNLVVLVACSATYHLPVHMYWSTEWESNPPLRAFTPISAVVTVFWLAMWFLGDRVFRCHTLFLCQDKKISVITKFLCEHWGAPLKTCAPSRENHKNAGKMVSHIGWLFSHKQSQMLVNSTILPQGQYIPRLRKLSWSAESWFKCHFGRLKKNLVLLLTLCLQNTGEKKKDSNSTWFFNIHAILVGPCRCRWDFCGWRAKAP